MIAHIQMDLADLVELLREYLSKRAGGAEIGAITITSYGQPKITIDATNMVEAVAFRHRA